MKTFNYIIGGIGNPLNEREARDKRGSMKADSEQEVWESLLPDLPYGTKTYHSEVRIWEA